MKKTLIYCIAIGLIAVTQSCQKDPWDKVADGDWNNEHSVISLMFKNQVGTATIERIDDAAGEIRVTLNVGAIPDISQVEVEKLQLSYNATSSVAVGSIVSFDNPEKKANITVTSPTGKTREYAIYATEFRESLEGRWSVNDLIVYGGTWPEWGGGAVISLQDKEWCWNYDNPPRVEYDNILTFTMDQITEDGNTSGVCINHAGTDGKYADFIFQGSQNKEGSDDIDLRKFYRQIPEGESRWLRDYSTGTISFTDGNNKVTTGVLEAPENYALDTYGNNIIIPDNAFSFILNGTDDESNIYSDYDKFVKKPRKFFVLVTKLD
jgi:hypothetical protein